MYVQFNTNKLVDAGIDIAVLLLIAWYLHHDAFDILTVFKFDSVDSVVKFTPDLYKSPVIYVFPVISW